MKHGLDARLLTFSSTFQHALDGYVLGFIVPDPDATFAHITKITALPRALHQFFLRHTLAMRIECGVDTILFAVRHVKLSDSKKTGSPKNSFTNFLCLPFRCSRSVVGNYKCGRMLSRRENLL
jgi:hypothetical protein